MKRLILIVLIVCFVVSIGIVALAKVSFGGWSKWDEKFPPKSYWNNSPGFLRELVYLDTKAPIHIAMNRYMENKKHEKISIILFSPFGENPESIFGGTGDYQFALVAFPPDKDLITIRAYRMENKVFRFFEEWKIPYENDYLIFKEENEFIVALEEWVGVKIDIRLIVFDSKKFTLLFDFETEKKEVLEYCEKALL